MFIQELPHIRVHSHAHNAPDRADILHLTQQVGIKCPHIQDQGRDMLPHATTSAKEASQEMLLFHLCIQITSD